MTPLELQDELIAELTRLFEHWAYKTPASEERTALKIFAQHLPVEETDEETDPVPYLIVRLISGDDDGTRDSNNVVKLVIIVCIWDNAVAAQGHRDVMNIIQKIYQRFHESPNLNGKAAYTGEFHWAAQEDSYYPYFFGACSIDFNVAAIRRCGDEYT